MRRVLIALVLGSGPVWVVSAQQPQPPAPSSAQATPGYRSICRSKCASCHGAAMTGATGPSILTYVRYHTNADIIGVMRTRTPQHPAVRVTDDQMTAVIADMRVLAGTNPNMATAGFTGVSRGGRGRWRLQRAAPAAARGAGQARLPPQRATTPAAAASGGAGTRRPVRRARRRADRVSRWTHPHWHVRQPHRVRCHRAGRRKVLPARA